MSILKLQNLTIQQSSATLVNNIDLEMGLGEMLAVVGPNGAGKSSLLRGLCGLLPFTGCYQLGGRDFNSWGDKERSVRLGYYAQQADIEWAMQVRSVIELGRLPHQGFRRQFQAADYAAVERAVSAAEVSHLLDRGINTLSGGEKARVMLARLFASESQLWLVDEPVAALDPYHALHVMELLRAHCDEGGSVIVVMHDLALAARFCDRVAVIHNASKVADGCPQQVLSDELLANVYGVEVARFNDGEADYIVPKSRQSHLIAAPTRLQR